MAKQVLLDTNFILSCIDKKIDFIEKLTLEGYEILIPKQVINEIKRIKNKNSELALKILLNSKIKKIDLKQNYVDKGIIEFSKKNNISIATIDKGLKNKLKSKKIIIRGKNLEEIN